MSESYPKRFINNNISPGIPLVENVVYYDVLISISTYYTIITEDCREKHVYCNQNKHKKFDVTDIHVNLIITSISIFEL